MMMVGWWNGERGGGEGRRGEGRRRRPREEGVGLNALMRTTDVRGE
jgi:hypothetical protein